MSRRKGGWSGITCTDLFCGAGGSTIGALRAGVEVRVASNHWPRAVETYLTNNPNTHVECADISNTDPRRFPSTDIAIMSPECTTHSPAGGSRRSKPQQDFFIPRKDDPSFTRSRCTMWDVPRFAEFHQYNVIIVENVMEVMRWMLFTDWLRTMHTLGYEHRISCMNSMFNHPTPQSRDRVYIVFWKKGNRAPDLEHRPKAPCPHCDAAVNARQTWKNGRLAGKYRQQYVYTCPKCHHEVTPFYFAALNAIDLSIPGTRIGDRPKELKPRTVERIQYGLDHFGNRPLVVRVNMTSRVRSRVRDACVSPLDTQFASNTTALVTPEKLAILVQMAYGEEISCRVRDARTSPMASQSTGAEQALVLSPAFVASLRNHNRARGLESAFTTITSGGNHFMVISGAAMISLRNADHMRTFGLDEPLSSQVASANQAGVMSHAPTPFLIDIHGSGKRKNAHQLHEAMKTLPSHDRLALVAPSKPPRIEDSYFRMVRPHEVGAGMAFPSTYVVTGNEGEQVRQFGQAVTPPSMDFFTRRAIASLAPETR